MINYAELRAALQGCELLPDQARQLERILQEHALYRGALEYIAELDGGELVACEEFAELAGRAVGYARAMLDGDS